MTNQVASYGWTLWLVIGGMAVVTYANRAGLLILSERFSLPAGLQRALKFAPASALAAIVVPDLLTHQGQINLTIDNLHLYAGMVGYATALLMRSTLPGIVAGMLALHGLQWAMG